MKNIIFNMNLPISVTCFVLFVAASIVTSSVKRNLNKKEIERNNRKYFMQDTLPEDHERFMNDMELCKRQTNASDMDISEWMYRVTPTTKEAKCLNACLSNQLGIVS